MSTPAPELLFGPYPAPALKVGDVATCLFKDCDVVVIDWRDAPIPWPRCRPHKAPGPPSPLVNEELARAIRSESALALGHWWRVSSLLVWKWRKAFGISRAGTEGSKRAIQAAANLGGDAQRGVPQPAEQVEQRRQTAIEQGWGDRLQHGYHGPLWTAEQLALLGTAPTRRWPPASAGPRRPCASCGPGVASPVLTTDDDAGGERHAHHRRGPRPPAPGRLVPGRGHVRLDLTGKREQRREPPARPRAHPGPRVGVGTGRGRRGGDAGAL